MGTRISRADFRRQYPAVYQGLFILSTRKGLPKDAPIINLGKELSAHLVEIPPDARSMAVDEFLRFVVSSYKAVSLTNLEILFTPSLKQNPIRALLALCRNKKICILWCGRVNGTSLTYAYPTSPEYYTEDCADCIDTYIVAD